MEGTVSRGDSVGNSHCHVDGRRAVVRFNVAKSIPAIKVLDFIEVYM